MAARERGRGGFPTGLLWGLAVIGVLGPALCIGLGVAIWRAASGGRAGEGAVARSTDPLRVGGLSPVTALVAGADHSLALAADGSVWGWGSNHHGQLGGPGRDRCGGFASDVSCSRAPARVPGLSGITAIAAGAYHNLALGAGGEVWAWGQNWSGQLGDGTTTNTCAGGACAGVPARVAVPGRVVALAAGGGHSLALTAGGEVWAWGGNASGQLGAASREVCGSGGGFTTPCGRAPVRVQGLGTITAIAAGGGHNLALADDRGIWAWGDNVFGQLGDGSFDDHAAPVRVAGPGGVVAIAAGRAHSLAATADGAVRSWGRGTTGGRCRANGRDTTSSAGSAITYACSAIPTPVGGASVATLVATGEGHNLAVATGGALLAWTGDAAPRSPATPLSTPPPIAPVAHTPVPGLGEVRAAAAGGAHSLALAADGAVWAWGSNAHAQLGR